MTTQKKKKMVITSKLFTIVFFITFFMIGSTAKLFACSLKKACSRTARMVLKASISEAREDYWVAVGNSYNLTDPEEREKLLQEAKEEWRESRKTAREQYAARLEVCRILGEAPYDPEIDPNDFVDFEAVLSEEDSFTPNPYFPLVAGTSWEYLVFDEEDEIIERILVEVLEETTEIEGVNCIVVRDRVWEIDDGEEVLIEDTDDWYAQDLEGNVWYFGEISLNFEDGQLVDIEGSWKAGDDYAKAGILMPADPQVGDVYRQEFLLAEAEDMGEVVSRGQAAVSVPFGDYDDDVLETRDWTPIEPDTEEFKYYAPDVGLILETNPEDGERVELIDMTTP